MAGGWTGRKGGRYYKRPSPQLSRAGNEPPGRGGAGAGRPGPPLISPPPPRVFTEETRALRGRRPCRPKTRLQALPGEEGAGPSEFKGSSRGASGRPTPGGFPATLQTLGGGPALPACPTGAPRERLYGKCTPLGSRSEGSRKCAQKPERTASGRDRKSRGWGLRRTGKPGHCRRRRRRMTLVEVGPWAGASVFLFFVLFF